MNDARSRELLSALWVFVTLNYLYADVMSLMDPILLPQWLAGKVGTLTITRPLLLSAAVMMEVPIAMTVLARFLPQRSNRIFNLLAAAFKTVSVLGSLALARPNPHYAFYASVEVITTLGIFWLALRWRPLPETSPLVG